MESQPQNPEFRNNPENFHPCGCELRTFLHAFNECEMIFCLC